MSRDQFYAKLGELDQDGLKKVLWTLYWRGSQPARERIEAQLDPDEQPRQQRGRHRPDPAEVLGEVEEFVALARAGAYLGSDRRVSPGERTRWRFTFRRLAAGAHQALLGDGDAGPDALELLVDLACDLRSYDYFRSEDPVQAAGFVVSDAVAQLWSAARERHGFARFADRAAPQLTRWESRYGWTRYGQGTVAEAETSLAEVLAGMLEAPDHWNMLAARYLDALDQLAAGKDRARRPSWRSADRDRDERAGALAAWHGMLLDRLVDSEADELLDRLAVHPALTGPELTFLEAQLAQRRGETDRARKLMNECLERLPGHRDFHAFARLIDAPLPRHAQQVAARRGV